MNPLALAANLIVLVHAAWVAFIVFGLAAILLGVALRWGWVRNAWFRAVHLAMILIVVGESLAGVPCPLTVWERRLRDRAGQETFEEDFIAHWAHRLMFFDFEPWVFTVVYVGFGLLVLATFVLAPPRLARGAQAADPEESTAG